jgi:hypothetical protein
MKLSDLLLEDGINESEFRDIIPIGDLDEITDSLYGKGFPTMLIDQSEIDNED